jgi:hypothetical protein
MIKVPNNRAATSPAIASRFQFVNHGRGVVDPPRSASMRVLLFVAFLALLQGCGPSYEPQFTMAQPQASNVVGCYTLKWKSVLNLAADGTFTATNVPPFVLPAPGSSTLSCLVTGSGTWRVEEIPPVRKAESSPQSRWGIALDSQGTAIRSPALIGNPPYALLFTCEESPHNETVMIFQKEKLLKPRRTKGLSQ